MAGILAPSSLSRPAGLVRRVELDVDGEQVGAERADVDGVQGAQRVPGDNLPLARERVSIRYYFPNKDELVAAALWRVGERVDDRIRRGTAGGMTMSDLRLAAVELLPLDADRREEALVYLAFLAQAAVTPELSDASEGAAQRLQEPLAARIARLAQAGELPAHLDAEHEAARLRVLLDGLRLQLVTTPKQTPVKWALTVLNDYLTALAAAPAAARRRGASAS
jgi:AcrR family transcriptional regulator